MRKSFSVILQHGSFGVFTVSTINFLLLAAGLMPRLHGLTNPSTALCLQATSLFIYMCSLKPLPQNIAYHNFADTRTLPLCCAGSIPNASDVISNIAFFVFSVSGMQALSANQGSSATQLENDAWFVFFLSGIMVSFGSAYYHWRPSNQTLFWDRAPMAIGFASIICLSVCERMPQICSYYVFGATIIAAVSSCLYWRWTDNLLPYLFVQFYGMLFIMELLILFPCLYTDSSSWWWIMLVYFVAKVSETFDMRLFRMSGSIISGHTMKHLFASLVFKIATNHVIQRQYIGNV